MTESLFFTGVEFPFSCEKIHIFGSEIHTQICSWETRYDERGCPIVPKEGQAVISKRSWRPSATAQNQDS